MISRLKLEQYQEGYMAKKIIIIDDDRDLLAELKDLMVSGGYDVAIFSDCEEALENIPKLKPDLILLDLKMDKISGFQVADRLRSSAKTETIPILAMTGHFPEQEYSLVMKICGIRKCIRKPFAIRDLFLEVENALR